MRKRNAFYSLAVAGVSLLVCAGVVMADSYDITAFLGGADGDFFDVQGTMMFDSIKVGRQGEGGVTFFNGTIINNTTGTGDSDLPVTFGDNVRIDGRVYRGATAGTGDTMPFIVNDNMEVVGSLTIGSLASADVIASANILDGAIATADLADGIVTSAKINDATIAAADLADNSVTSAKITDGTITGSDISSSADLSVDTVAATGNITQTADQEGVIKGWAYVDAGGTLLASYNVDSVSQTATGRYEVTFDFVVSDGSGNATRAYIAVPSGVGGAVAQRIIGAAPDNSDPNIVKIWTNDSDNSAAGGVFMLAIF